MKYGLLSAKRGKSDGCRGYDAAWWETLDDLYCGGIQIQENVDKYLKKAPGESPERYKARKDLAGYVGYLGQIVNQYASAMFSGPVSVTPAGDADDPNTPGEVPEPEVYEALSDDADLRGTSFVGVLQDTLRTALVKKRALIAVDFPANTGPAPKNRADSKSAGLGQPYVYEMPPEEMLWWEYHDQVRQAVPLDGGGTARFTVGRFSWCITRKIETRRATPEDPVDNPVEVYKVWNLDENGQVTWTTYNVPIVKGKKPQPEVEVEIAEQSGPTTFREIPIVEIELPDTLWLGNLAGLLCLELWRRRSELLAAQQRSLITIPVVYLGPQTGAFHGPLPADVAQQQSRGDDPKKQYESKGFVVLAQGDKLAFEGPDTAPFQIVATQLQDLTDEIFRVTGKMAASISNTSTALGRSGESKSADNNDFCVVLKALAAILRDAARRVYEIISDARGENVKWAVHGLDQFDPDEDRAALLGEAVQILGAGPGSPMDLPSGTAKAEYWSWWFRKWLPGVSQQTMTTIIGELKAHLEQAAADAEQAKADAAAQAAALAQQQGLPSPGAAKVAPTAAQRPVGPTPPRRPPPPSPAALAQTAKAKAAAKAPAAPSKGPTAQPGKPAVPAGKAQPPPAKTPPPRPGAPTPAGP